MQNGIDRENSGAGVLTSASNFFGLIKIYNCDFETLLILRWFPFYVRFVVMIEKEPLKKQWEQ